MERIFSTVGGNSDGIYEVNGVTGDNLINYNKTYRPGRALFVESICHNKGDLPEWEVIYWSDRIVRDKETFWRDTDTQPYK